jgi:hypothetical protein
MDNKASKSGFFKKNIGLKHLLLMWFMSILGFGVVLAIATKLFTSTVQETEFGNSSYFLILLLGFAFIGTISFGFAMIVAFVKILRKIKKLKIINSPVFLILLVVFAFVAGVFGTKLINPISEQIKSNSYTPSFVEKRVPNILPDEVFELTNNERVNNGLKPLKRSVKLDEAALERAKVIIEYNEWAHEATRSGIPYTEAIKKAHYWNINYGENLANGQYSSSEVVNGWMNSASHKANILDTKFQEVGIATYSGQLNGVSTVVTVQLFGGYQPPNYKADYLTGWESSLNSLISVKPSWENIKNYPSTYNANKQDADRLIEIMNIRISRMQKIVARIKANQWFTAEENRWTYEDKGLYDEQEAIAKRLNSQTWR